MSQTRRIMNLPPRIDDGHDAALIDIVACLVEAGIAAHHAVGALVTTADASDLATSQALAAALGLAVPAHAADIEAHTTADAAVVQAAAWSSAPSVPADLAEVQATLNEIKADLNTHVGTLDHHRGQPWGAIVTDGVRVAHVIGTADATDQSSANALANAIKAFLNLHSKGAAKTVVRVGS